MTLTMIKREFIGFIMLSFCSLGASNLTSAQDSGIKEISDNQFIDEFGYVHVLGEIQNALSSKMDFVKVNVAYYDSQNRIIGSDFVYSDPSSLLSGQSATYQALTSPNSLASSDVSSVKVNYEYQVSGITYQSLGHGNRPVTSNSGQPFGEQNNLGPSDLPMGPSDVPMGPTDVPMGPSDPDCGKVIHGNFRLTANLVCRGEDGLIVGADNTVINLGGYSITGPGPESNKVGIAIPHANSVIVQGNGSISNFQAGILVTGSVNTKIHGVTFEGNKIAIFMTGSFGATVEQNLIGPNTIGVASHSSNGLQMHANNITKNDLAGITLVNTDGSQVDANTIGGSRNGIFLDAQSTKNKILNNNVTKNDIDINNADGLPVIINENELSNNSCFISNPSGLCVPQ